jgi:hypothetical protein
MGIVSKPEESTHRRCHLVSVGLVMAVLVGLAAVLWTSQPTRTDSGETSPSPIPSSPPVTNSSSTSTTVSSEEIIARLHEIFRIRDRAIRTRNASLLEGIYTVDCPCLKGDKQLIQRLREQRLVWRGIEVTLTIKHARQVNDRLWIVNALVTTNSFEIVNESAAVVRRIPSGQESSRFALAKPVGNSSWSLGYALVTQESD